MRVCFGIAGEVEELRDDLRKRFSVVEKTVAGVRVLHKIRADLDARDRCAQVMRDAGQHDRPFLLGVAQFTSHFVEVTNQPFDFRWAVGQDHRRTMPQSELTCSPCEPQYGFLYLPCAEQGDGNSEEQHERT